VRVKPFVWAGGVLLAIVMLVFSFLRNGPDTDPGPDAQSPPAASEIRPSGEVAGVVMNVPADCLLEQRGALGDTAAIGALVDLADTHRDRPRVGISCMQGEREVHFLLDRDAGTILRQVKSGRTLTETRWSGDVDARLRYAAQHGTFETPGLMPGIGKNLYH